MVPARTPGEVSVKIQLPPNAAAWRSRVGKGQLGQLGAAHGDALSGWQHVDLGNLWLGLKRWFPVPIEATYSIAHMHHGNPLDISSPLACEFVCAWN